jgi:hypothetical protein
MVAVLLPAVLRGVLAGLRDVRDLPDTACERMLRLPQTGGFPVTRLADPPPEGVSYVEYLQREIEDRLRGYWTCCGPPIADYPTLVDRIWPYRRPNSELEAQLEAQLREIEAQLRAAEAELEI